MPVPQFPWQNYSYLRLPTEPGLINNMWRIKPDGKELQNINKASIFALAPKWESNSQHFKFKSWVHHMRTCQTMLCIFIYFLQTPSLNAFKHKCCRDPTDWHTPAAVLYSTLLGFKLHWIFGCPGIEQQFMRDTFLLCENDCSSFSTSVMSPWPWRAIKKAPKLPGGPWSKSKLRYVWPCLI